MSAPDAYAVITRYVVTLEVADLGGRSLDVLIRETDAMTHELMDCGLDYESAAVLAWRIHEMACDKRGIRRALLEDDPAASVKLGLVQTQ